MSEQVDIVSFFARYGLEDEIKNCFVNPGAFFDKAFAIGSKLLEQVDNYTAQIVKKESGFTSKALKDSKAEALANQTIEKIQRLILEAIVENPNVVPHLSNCLKDIHKQFDGTTEYFDSITEPTNTVFSITQTSRSDLHKEYTEFRTHYAKLRTALGAATGSRSIPELPGRSGKFGSSENSPVVKGTRHPIYNFEIRFEPDDNTAPRPVGAVTFDLDQNNYLEISWAIGLIDKFDPKFDFVEFAQYFIDAGADFKKNEVQLIDSVNLDGDLYNILIIPKGKA